MIQFDHIGLYACYNTCNSAQFTRFIRKLNGYGKDTITQDQTFLYNGRHGDNIHISTTQDRYNPFIFHIQMFQCCYCQQTGVFYDHLMILYHIKECYNKLIIVNSNDVIQIFLNIWENFSSRSFYSSTICNGIYLR